MMFQQTLRSQRSNTSVYSAHTKANGLFLQRIDRRQPALLSSQPNTNQRNVLWLWFLESIRINWNHRKGNSVHKTEQTQIEKLGHIQFLLSAQYWSELRIIQTNNIFNQDKCVYYLIMFSEFQFNYSVNIVEI